MIDRDQVQKVANLARLSLTPEEEINFTGQINDILTYVEQLSELDTQDVPPTTRAIDQSNVLRGDHQITYGDRDALLGCAPDRDEDFLVVPKILGD